MTYPPGSYGQPPQNYKQGIDWNPWRLMIAALILIAIIMLGIPWYLNRQSSSSSISQPAQQIQETSLIETTEPVEDTETKAPTGGGIGLGTGGN